MNKTISATLLLQRPDGKILMQLRDDGRGNPIPFPNAWNFPGGVVEPGEPPVQAAVREVFEEFRIKIDPAACCEIFRYTHQHAAVDYVFLSSVPSDTEPVLLEGAAWAWMTLEEISEIELAFDKAKILASIPQQAR